MSWEEGGPMREEARLIRRMRFRSSHHYRRDEWTDEQNRRAFGSQVRSHAHDWTLVVEVVGPIDDQTGFVTDLAALDRALAQLTEGWDSGDLNRLVPDVRAGSMIPTTESLARWVHERLRGAVPAPARLDRVRVFESQELGSQFPA